MRLCRYLKQPPPPVSVSLLLNSVINEASPKLTLVIWVHGSICFASKVLWEFTWIWHCADDPESWRTVRICHNTLMGALRCLDRAPYLWGTEMRQKWWVIQKAVENNLLWCKLPWQQGHLRGNNKTSPKSLICLPLWFLEWFAVPQTSMYFPTFIFYSSRSSVCFKCSFNFLSSISWLRSKSLYSNLSNPPPILFSQQCFSIGVYYRVLHYKAYNRSCCLPTAMVLHTIEIYDIPAFLEPVRNKQEQVWQTCASFECGKCDAENQAKMVTTNCYSQQFTAQYTSGGVL